MVHLFEVLREREHLWDKHGYFGLKFKILDKSQSFEMHNFVHLAVV